MAQIRSMIFSFNWELKQNEKWYKKYLGENNMYTAIDAYQWEKAKIQRKEMIDTIVGEGTWWNE